MLLSLVLVGCLQPAVPEIGDNTVVSAPGTGVEEAEQVPGTCYVDADEDGAVYPTTPDCQVPEDLDLDCDDGDPEMDADACAAREGAHEQQAEQYGWTYTWLEFNFNAGNGDYEDQLTVNLSNGTWFSTNNGWVELPGAYNPLTITMVVSAQDRYVYSADEIRAGLKVEMVSEEGDELGAMTPEPGMAEYSVTYIAP